MIYVTLLPMPDPYNLILSLLISLIIQLIFFAFAYKFKTDKVTDLSYSLTFMLIAILLGIINRESVDLYKIALIWIVCLWGSRLAGYLLMRIIKMKTDKRFDGIRENFKSFLGFWILQAFTVWIVMIPVSIFISIPIRLESNSIFPAIGFIIFIVGLILETFADIQKFNFKSKPENKDKWIQTGVWKYSRHPNYFGEILVWIGVFIFTLINFTSIQIIGIVSPIFITILLLFVSGIPILERKYNQKYKDNAEYQMYKNSTSLIIPWFKG